jgi:hypothetical protein
MKIQFNKVTWYSKALALALFVILPFLGFYLGIRYGRLLAMGEAMETTRQATMPVTHCGGFIKNAKTCPQGYRCQLGRIPDAGGTCVPQ